MKNYLFLVLYVERFLNNLECFVFECPSSSAGRAHVFYLRPVKLLLSEQRSWGRKFESCLGRFYFSKSL